jgi:ribose 5-phosphate isomerase B
MKIAIASDHAGFELKKSIIQQLNEQRYDFEDFGTYSLESVDYTEYGKLVGYKVANAEFDLGLLFCGTGIGIGLSATKIPGIRAAICSDYFSAKYSRLHNNANILSLGGRVVGPGLAWELVNVFLTTEFEGGRHEARVNNIENC